MNREDIIRMVREAGDDIDQGSACVFMTNELLIFARLIAEDCAKRCDEIAEVQEFVASTFAVASAAAAIREAYKP